MSPNIWYADIMKLGFVKEYMNDEVFHKQFGRDDYYCILTLNDKFSIEWTPEKGNCTVIKNFAKDDSIYLRNIDDLDLLKGLIKLLK